MSPKIVDKVEKRRQIGLLALSYFAKEGTVTGSISQIARAVGIGKGTIYEYFHSKEELITYEMELYVQEAEEQVGSLLDGLTNPKERLSHYSISIVEHIIEDPKTTGILLAIFQLLLASRGTGPQNTHLEGMFRQARRTIIGMLKDGVDQKIFTKETGDQAEVLAINLIAFLDGLWMHSLISKDIDLKYQVNHYLDNMYAAIGVDQKT